MTDIKQKKSHTKYDHAKLIVDDFGKALYNELKMQYK